MTKFSFSALFKASGNSGLFGFFKTFGSFSSLRELPRRELARLTQIDYAREMAFIAVREAPGQAPETLGVVRAVTDPDNLGQIGGGVFSITRICTVLVWLRSNAVLAPVALPAAAK
jgi:hypothetical protein